MKLIVNRGSSVHVFSPCIERIVGVVQGDRAYLNIREIVDHCMPPSRANLITTSVVLDWTGEHITAFFPHNQSDSWIHILDEVCACENPWCLEEPGMCQTALKKNPKL